jgi:NADPH:quinone reductase-like Zn-dependent oxidoreductase
MGKAASLPGDIPSASAAVTMRAVVYQRYGGADALELAEVPVPVPAEGEVRLKVVATSINAADYRILTATPFLARMHNGLFRPRRQILGFDVAGVVEAVGPGCSTWKVGDAVFGNTYGDHWGAFAEHVCVREGSVVSLPEGVSFDEAASVPLAGVTAWQGVRDVAGVIAGQRVMVQGAGGGVGTFMVQLAQHLGAEVSATCGPGSIDRLRSFGLHELINYREEDFTARDERYDVIVAINGYQPLKHYVRCLTDTGTYVMCGGTSRQIFQTVLFSWLTRRGPQQTVKPLNQVADTKQADLEELGGLLASGALKASVAEVFPLEELPAAMAYVLGGHVPGKVVIHVQDP